MQAKKPKQFQRVDSFAVRNHPALAKPIRIEPALADRAFVRSLFDRHAPYRAAAAHLPDGSDETGDPRPADAVLPWFRDTWAVGGKPMIDGGESILHNSHFIQAARVLFPSARIVPKIVVVNINAPMPAGVAHVDVPVFRGASRENFALRLLMAMGASELFEPWRIIETGAITWFYEGLGGGFDYWPDGPEGSMQTERAPFGNVAIVADSDRMYHRIARIGPADSVLPRMTASAEIRRDSDDGWCIFDENVCRARYPNDAVRLSVAWKAEVVFDEPTSVGSPLLTQQRILQILQADLRQRGIPCEDNLELLQDPQWIARVHRTYACLAKAAGPRVQ
jgi:hypothetical protein